ncbi:hypothetical protein DID88_004166 [Monilinia fructigena]|uniref:U6 snRNA-associated Sm-like protein LSm6 n=1 Tax=Monilinia fructigena TaxID=38457 RepID=A0A395ISF7_9HELO|nr:hypothetical protein DID88_004166 [Monilinia fructigena]
MENGALTQSEGKDPSSFLSEIIGSRVIVKLNNSLVFKGELQSVDGYMNIALENARSGFMEEERQFMVMLLCGATMSCTSLPTTLLK